MIEFGRPKLKTRAFARVFNSVPGVAFGRSFRESPLLRLLSRRSDRLVYL